MQSDDLITRQIEAIHARFAGLDDGEVATYIPELATADPDRFGIAVASRSGGVYTAGDAEFAFTIQSVSKPFVYAMALTEIGLEPMLARAGAEPSGEAFNAISLEPDTGRPANPMINAGAIVTTSLIAAANADERFERIKAMLSEFAGRSLAMDERVYRSERETGDKNRALAWLMRNAGSLDADVDEALEVYFKQCSLLVTARDIAVMTATLANGGINPITGKPVVSDSVASQVLTMMATCGMYDYSGEWLLRVGLPAKSGVSGAVVAASPGQFGLGLFSPRLDARGNSVRAIAGCRELSDTFELHLLRTPSLTTSALYLEGTARHLRSDVERSATEQRHLRRHGDRIQLRGLHGDIGFADAEQLLQSISPMDIGGVRWLLLDLTRVRSAGRAAAIMIAELIRRLQDAGIAVGIASSDPPAELVADARKFPTLDAALEWAEDALLQETN